MNDKPEKTRTELILDDINIDSENREKKRLIRLQRSNKPRVTTTKNYFTHKPKISKTRLAFLNKRSHAACDATFDTQKECFTFANVLNNRNLNVSPNTVWGIDFTTIPTELENHTGSKHLVLLIIDHFSRKVIYSKVFFLKKGQGSISAKKVIKALESCKFQRQITESCLVHTDNGTEFVNEEYYNYIIDQPFFIGSTSHKGHCEHNAVVERTIKTIKTGMTQIPESHAIKIEIPDIVKTTQACETIIQRRIRYYNETFVPKFNGDLNCKEKEKRADNTQLLQPEALLVENDHYFKTKHSVFEVKKYHNLLHKQEQGIQTTGFQGMQNQLQIQDQKINQIGYAMIQQTQLQQVISDHVKTLLKKKKRQHVKQILRNPVPNTVFEQIIYGKIPYKKNSFSWKRFQIMVAILYFTGLRVNELKQFHRQVLLHLIENGKADIYQSKTKALKTIILPESAKKVFKHLKVAIDTVCPNKGDFLYDSPDPQNNKIVEYINKRLKPYADEANLNLTSHSFRAGYITELLRKAPIEKVRQIVGHADIRSTEVYNRHILENVEKKQLLDQAFDDCSEET